MITSVSEYYEHLHQIQDTNPPTLALIPNREKIYKIDLDTRTIETPEFLSVQKDHAAETVYFLADRYYDYVDLATTVCIIQYINAKGEARIYPVPFYDVQSYTKEWDEETGEVKHKMLIPWNIGAGATAAAGIIKYSIRFYRLDRTGKKFEYNLNTLTTSSRILYGLDAQDIMTDDEAMSAASIDELLQTVNNIKRDQRLNWIDLY